MNLNSRSQNCKRPFTLKNENGLFCILFDIMFYLLGKALDDFVGRSEKTRL